MTPRVNYFTTRHNHIHVWWNKLITIIKNQDHLSVLLRATDSAATGAPGSLTLKTLQNKYPQPLPVDIFQNRGL